VSECRAYEDRFIRDNDAVKDPRWLNGNCGGATFYNAGMIVVKDSVTGEPMGNQPIDHLKILSGEWVHHSTGQVIKSKACQYCHRDVLVTLLTDHEDHCEQNPDHKKRICQYCNQEFTDRRNHVRHERHCEQNPDREPLPEYECQFCKKIYLDAGKRNDHEKYCDQNPDKLDKPVYHCQYCGEEFHNNRMTHSYHEKHCDDNPNREEWPDHRCRFCDKKFNSPGPLKQHEVICQHNPDRKIQECQYCNRAIGGGKGNLIQHERGCKHNSNR
jgi:hypothetical protein